MTDRVRKYVPAMVEVFVSDMDCYVCMANYRNLERDLAKARKAAEWKPITPEMKLTKNHVLATGLDASHTFVMAYSGGYRNGASALADDWNYCMKLNPPAPEGASKRTWHCNSKLPISEMCPECQEKRREYMREYLKTPKQREYQREYAKTPKRRKYQREYMRKTRKAAKLAATVADRWRGEA